MKKFPGDLLAVEATCIDLTWGEFHINGRSFYTSNQSKYKNDIEIVQKIISIDPTQIEKFPKFKKDKDMIYYANKDN